MKSGPRLIALLIVLFPLTLFIMSGCSTDAASDTSTEEATLSALTITASPTTIGPGGVTTIEVVAYDSSGNNLSGVDISFAIDNPTLAAITASKKTDSSGVAEAILTARNVTGEVQVTASSGEVSDVITISISDSSPPDRINLTITPASITIQGTASVQAEVLDENGNPVSDGTQVSFSADNTFYGNFTSATSSTTNGFAYATFQAGNNQGTASITVQTGDVSAFADIVIYPAEATSVEFVSADPQRIALQGSGGTVTSVIQFVVKDSNGNPVEGVKVFFAMTGPNGGEAIDHTPNDNTPDEIEISSDENGLAEVILSSGYVAGPVTIQATITSTDSLGNEIDITSQSSTISIGGGVPSAKRFSVAATTLNLPGLAYNDVETSITAYLADRFGNYNILEGTTVSFVSELGLAIDTSDITVGEDGKATGVARTQIPAGSSSAAEDVAEEPWETLLLDSIETNFGITLSGNPRDGLASVMVYVKGEEHFEDENANGYYNPGESFTDTYDDPFVDYNDDGYRDDGTLDPFEEYIDSNGNGIWDGVNGVWDSDKTIFYNFNILLTGIPSFVESSIDTFAIADGGYTEFYVLVCDKNGNIPTAGSSISVSSSAGILSGVTSYDIPDTNSPGPFYEHYVLWDDDVGDTDDPENATITIEFSWGGEGVAADYERTLTIPGTIN